MKRYVTLLLGVAFLGCGPTKPEDSGAKEITPGIYAGRISCESCPTQSTALHLKPDGTYTWKDSPADTNQNNRWELRNGLVLRGAGGKTLDFVVDGDKLRTANPSSNRTERRDFYLQKFPDVFDMTWKLVRLKDQPVEVTDVRVPTLRLLAKEFRAGGNGGCNTYSGAFSLSQGSGISFGPIAATKMFCHDALYEPDFLRMLEQTDRLKLERDTLVLYGQRRPLAKFVSG